MTDGTDREWKTGRLVCLGIVIAYDDKKKRHIRHRYCPEEAAGLAVRGEAQLYEHEVLMGKPLCAGPKGFDNPGSIYEGRHTCRGEDGLGVFSTHCGEWKWVGCVEDDEIRNIIQAIAYARRREVDLLNLEKRAKKEDGLLKLTEPLREVYMASGGGRARTAVINRIVSLITGVSRR